MLPLTKSGPVITSITQSCKVDNNKLRSQNTLNAAAPHDSTDLDCPASMRVCRVCLITGVKMYHLSEHQLGVMYERITSIKINADNKFPRMLCWECSARLSSANLFREKALKSQWILYNKGNNGKVITMRDIISVNRTSSQLESSLGTKFSQEEDIDQYLLDKSSVNTESNEIEGIYIKKEVDPFGFEELNVDTTESNFTVTLHEENAGVKGEGGVASYADDDEMLEEDPIEVGEGSKKTRKRKNKCDMGENSINETQTFIDQQDIGSTSQATEDDYPEIPLETCLVEDTAQDNSLKNILICDFCNKVFSRKTSLQEHMNYKHNKNISFDCPICPFSTRIKSCLTRHIKAKHTQSISFHCPHCTFKTYLKSYLDKHVNYKHTKKTSFKCSLCDFETFHQSSLGKHVKCKHTKSALHLCSYCDYHTCDKSNLRKHISTKHNQ